jgi:CheY-like chemotaxis protein
MPARLLIVEDNPANLELMRYLLHAYGHTVLCVGDGERGVAVARTELPDLILCDVQLPALDGYGVVHSLKQDAACSGIPLIAITALAMVGDRDRVLAAGFDGYMTKPITPETFVTEVDAFLPPQLRSASTPARV